MRPLLLICPLLCIQSAFAQMETATLARRLTVACTNDRQKVSAIFHWITDNISYRVKTPSGKIRSQDEKPWPVIDDNDTTTLKPLNERVAETVLATRVAVCDGYARLFNVLCDHAGIRSEIIIGFAKGNPNKPVGRFGANHYWNAVYLDSSWQLLDATWASGYVNLRGDVFTQSYDDNYFLTSPEIFLQDHYPDDIRWTLMPDAPAPREFKNSPFRQKSFVKYRITSYHPLSGIIEVDPGDSVLLDIETSLDEPHHEVVPDLLIDSSIFSASSAVFLTPSAFNEARPGRQEYLYRADSLDAKWLYLMFNGDLVLRYKVIVHKEKMAWMK